jgi:hypothetical protein
MAKVYLAGRARDSANLFWGVTSSYGDPYLIKVGDPAKFRAFAEKIVQMQSGKRNAKFSDKYDSYLNSNDPVKNEEGFLKMLKELKVNGGITLYRGNSTCTQWTKLESDGFGGVKTTNCN